MQSLQISDKATNTWEVSTRGFREEIELDATAGVTHSSKAALFSLPHRNSICSLPILWID
jgi:hypothetical protein